MELNTSSFATLILVFPTSVFQVKETKLDFFKEESYPVAVRRKGQIRPGQGDFLGAVTVVHSRI